jgi:hypothetical protein
LPNVITGGNDKLLVFAVDDLAHTLDEKTFGVALEDGIPLTAPQDLDNVPAGAAEGGFQFLNNLAIATNGTIEALKVAVDDEDEVVKFFAGGKSDSAERFGLIGFTVAEEGPNFCVGGGLQTAVFQVAIEACLIDGHERAESHGDSGIFPEIGHEPGMRIGGESTAGLQFTAEVFQLLDADATFEEGARIYARGGVALEVDGVTFEIFAASAEEMVEADFIECGGGGVGGDVTADVVLQAIGADDHGESVPANEGLDTALELLVSGEERFEAGGNGVGIRSVGGEREINATDGGVGAKTFEDFARNVGTAGFQDGIKGLEPFLNFDVVDVSVRYCFLIHSERPTFFPSKGAKDAGAKSTSESTISKNSTLRRGCARARRS